MALVMPVISKIKSSAENQLDKVIELANKVDANFLAQLKREMGFGFSAIEFTLKIYGI